MNEAVGSPLAAFTYTTARDIYITFHLADILRPMPLTYRDAVQRMAEDYNAVFGGRDAELTELDTFLAQEEKPYALLLAPTGRGKTALLIHWVARVQADAQWTVIFAPISIRYQTASEGTTFSALAHALGAFYGESEQVRTYNQTPEQLRGLVADYLGRPLRDDRRLLLVLDGLDEAVNWRMSRALFPRTPSPHLRIVAAAREMARTSRDDWLETLGWRAGQTWAITLSELSREAVSDVLRRMGDPLHRLSASTDLPTEIARVSEGDPLTIRLLVEALHDGTLTPNTLTRLPPGLEAYVRNWLIELETRGEQNPAVYTLLGLCAVALGPLTDVDIQRLAPDVFVHKISLNQAVGSVARFIIGDGSEASGYVFSHARLREIFLEKELSSNEQEQFRHRFVTYGQAWYERRTRPLPTYLRLFWIAHLANADMWDVVRRVVTEVVPVEEKYEQPWAAARYAVEGSYAGYLSDLDVLWRWADTRV